MENLEKHMGNSAKLLVGIGTFKKLIYEIQSFNSKNVLIIADSAVKKNNLLQLVTSTIAPSIDNVRIHLVQNVKGKLKSTYSFPTTLLTEQYDAIIGVGGNDLLNYTKIFAKLTCQLDEEAQSSTSIITKSHKNKKLMLLPLVVTNGMEVTNKTYTYNNDIKIVKNNELLLASTIIYDPLLSSGCSLYKRVTSSTITLAHAFEVHFFSEKLNKFPIATINLLFNYVIRATYNKRDIEAQEALLKSGMLLGLTNVYCLKVPLVKCFAIPLMRKTNCSYAFAIALMLPHLMKVYRDVNEQRGEVLARALDVYNEDRKDMYDELSFRLTSIFKNLGYPLTLESLGISINDILNLGNEAFTIWLTNDYESLGWNERYFISIFTKAFTGDIDNSFN